jgi:hypothetical protein
MRSTRWRGDDSGATLVIALIFITVIAVVLGAVLAFADTSIRTTVALRGQAAATAGADGAANVAIRLLGQGSYTGSGDCFSGGSTLALSNFFQVTGGAASSVAVTCAPDTAKSATDPGVAINNDNRPGNAILTLAPPGTETGVFVNVNGGATLKVHGSVFSNSTINVAQGTLGVDTDVIARGSCSGTITSTPPKICNYGATPNPLGDDPNYSPPALDLTPRTVPACKGRLRSVEFQPGLYTDVAALNSFMRNSGCKDGIYHFNPGVYTFNFSSNTEWLIDTGDLVAGLPTVPFQNGVEPTIPGACVSPIPPTDPVAAASWQRPPPGSGVAFVFAGTSRMHVGAAKVEVCGEYSLTRPPVAVYGLKAAIGSVPALTGCLIQTPYPSTGCPVILSDNAPDSRLFIQGTTYVPTAALDISLNNNTGQVFRFGVISRTLRLNPTGSANLDGPVIEVPDLAASFGRRTVIALTVYVCDGASTCSAATGRLRLRTKVDVVDPTGFPVAGSREITVLSWSVQR